MDFRRNFLFIIREKNRKNLRFFSRAIITTRCLPVITNFSRPPGIPIFRSASLEFMPDDGENAFVAQNGNKV
jgi:hypothetical protein